MKYETTQTPAAITKSSTKKLIELFIATNMINDENIPTVRGWIMDELDRRDPEAFDRWLEESSEDEELKKYFA